MNYQLRGDESERDQEFVVDWCENRGIPYLIKKVSLVGEGSIQMEARNLRYAWFNELIENEGFNKVMLAHHLNDQFETALLNLTRGTGISGITGMHHFSGVLCRPLLEFTRAELLDYVRKNSISWTEDTSNSSIDYNRNRIRHLVIPELEKLNPTVINTFGRTRRRMVGIELVFKERVRQVRKLIDRVANGEIILPLCWCRDDLSDVAILAEIIQDFHFTFLQAEEILHVKGSGKMFESRSHILNVDRKMIRINAVQEKSGELSIHEPGKYKWGRWEINIQLSSDCSIDPDCAVGKVDRHRMDFSYKSQEFYSGRFILSTWDEIQEKNKRFSY